MRLELVTWVALGSWRENRTSSVLNLWWDDGIFEYRFDGTGFLESLHHAHGERDVMRACVCVSTLLFTWLQRFSDTDGVSD